jgi:cytochrome aa3-600 menaquinol oxidase subunit 2
MNNVKKPALLSRVTLFIMAALATVLLAGCENSQYIVLDPKGPVGEIQANLIWISIILCAIVAIPVLAMLVYIVWRYRDKPGNKAPYTPEWAHSTTLEVIWWGIPIIIIGILGYFAVRDTYDLAKPLPKETKPVVVQVTSLDWKWLFQYPEQGIASVNYIEIPTGVPVQFVLTSDAPMNSFWIPQLGGQTYTMPGMAMGMWLQADEPGEYFGSGASFTGEGFAHMQFKVVAKPKAEFDKWVQNVKQTAPALTKDGYAKLAKPGLAEKQLYSSFPPTLFKEIVDKNGGQYYRHHEQHMNHGTTENSTNHENQHANHGASQHENHDMSGMKVTQ